MKAISLWQPYASLVAIGAKKIETRSWPTKYRGPLAIHAAKSFPHEMKKYCLSDSFTTALYEAGISSSNKLPLHFGVVLCVCHLVNCLPITQEFVATLNEQEKAFGDYTAGRYAWILEDVRMLPEPIPAKGMQRLWQWEMPRTEAMVTP